MGLLRNLLAKKQYPAKKAEEWKRKQTEHEVYQKAYQHGRQATLRKRGFQAGRQSARPFSQKVSEGLGSVGRGLSAVDRAFGAEFGFKQSPTRKQHRKSKRRRRVSRQPSLWEL